MPPSLLVGLAVGDAVSPGVRSGESEEVDHESTHVLVELLLSGLGLLMTKALGLGLVAWVGVTLWWGEPFTSLYTRHEQTALSKLQALDRKWSGTVRLSPAGFVVYVRPKSQAFRHPA